MSFKKSPGRFAAVAAFAVIGSSSALAQGVAPGAVQSGVNQAWPAIVAPLNPMEPGPGWPPREVNVTRPLPGRPFQEKFIELEGFRIRYIDSGKGAITVVSIPGSGGLELSTAKDILAKDYRVIELNPPGRGPDDAITKTYDLNDMARIFLVALDRMGVKQFHLISTSAGCNIGMQMAQMSGGRALSFTGEGGECFTRPEDRRGQTPRAVAAQQASNQGKGVFDPSYELWSGWPAYQWAPNKWWQTPAFQSRLMRRRYTKVPPPNTHRAEMVANAKGMTIPVTDLVGDRDEIMKTTVGEAWKAANPAFKFVIVPGGTHDIQNSQPEQFVEIIKACSIERLVGGLMCPGD